jgi:hypothetical protein
MGNLFEGKVIAMTGAGRECALLAASEGARLVFNLTDRSVQGHGEPGGAGPGSLVRRAAAAQRLRRPRPAPSPSGRRRGIEQPGAPLPQVHSRGVTPLRGAQPQPCSARPWPGASTALGRLSGVGRAPDAN